MGSRAGAPPTRPRAGVAQVSGVFSAFLVMMCVVVTAGVLEITGRLQPKPIFIGSQWPWPQVASVAPTGIPGTRGSGGFGKSPFSRW